MRYLRTQQTSFSKTFIWFIAVVFLSIGSMLAYRMMDALLHYARTTGVVVDLKWTPICSPVGINKTGCHIVEFVAKDGKKYRFTDSRVAAPERDLGKSVTVLYDPAAPQEHATEENYIFMYLAPLMLVSLGAFVLYLLVKGKIEFE